MFAPFIYCAILVILVCILALLAIVGWIMEGAKLDRARNEIGRLNYEKNKLRETIRRLDRRSTIRTADEYSKEED